jgi:hypothetical protein
VADAQIRWNVNALAFADLYAEEHVLPKAAEMVAVQARTIGPIRTGKLKASVGWELGSDGEGPFADVYALWYGRFMDPKAKQLKRLHPFLPTSLETLNGRDLSA